MKKMKGNQDKYIKDKQIINTAIDFLEEVQKLLKEHSEWTWETRLGNTEANRKLVQCDDGINPIKKRLKKLL